MKSQKYLIVTLFLFCAFFSSNKAIATQDSITVVPDKKNTIYASSFDYALPLVVYYDRIIYKASWFKLSLAGGFGPDVLFGRELFFPAEFNFLIGKQKNFFEVGTGTLSIIDDGRTPLETYTTLKFGYRRQKPEGGFFMRASIITTTFFKMEVKSNGRIEIDLDDEPFASIALGAGYTF